MRKSYLVCLVVIAFSAPLFAITELQRLPTEFDVRGTFGVPKGTALRPPTAPQVRALASLDGKVAGTLQVSYNGLTGTPRHILSHAGPLSPPSNLPAEQIARSFIYRWREAFRFSERDIANLRLVSRATALEGQTILLFEQQVNGLPVYKGEVLVNINNIGQVISVGGESFPQLRVTNSVAITPAAAVQAAASALGVNNFTPVPAGTEKVLTTFGDLPHELIDAPKFSRGGQFLDDIVVTRTIFPMGDTGRHAYQFVLTTRAYDGFMWENIVDAQTGQVLRRISLTASLGPRGGGSGAGRLGTLRPDLQDRIESFNNAGTAAGKVFDTMPTALSGRLGFGRSPARGTPPTYAAETVTDRNLGRGFKFTQLDGRISSPFVYPSPFGQVTRGIPDAQNPTAESPFGWFYLPTDNGGAELAAGTPARAATRAYGYSMTAAARDRNLPENSPAGDKNQPFSASVTPTGRSTILNDGRVLTSVIESHYTEGNNVLVADDREDDNESTHGIRGFDIARQFTKAYYDFVNGYEYGGVDVTTFGDDECLLDGRCGNNYPPGTVPDIFPGTVALFFFNNVLHDYLYSIGFTETLWNFQQDNFARGGAGNDAVSAQVQDGSGTNNANFGTPQDGSRPRMQMFLWTEASTRRSDGDFDFDVVAHELYHGVSNRSAGKGRTGCLGLTAVGESGGQGEGWSDTIAESMTDDDATAEYPVGEFDVGIRRLPTTNFRYSYGAIDQKTMRRRDGGVDINTAVSTGTGSVPFAVHYVGTIFSSITWDMRELMIVKDPNGIFFDGTRRFGGGKSFYIGPRRVQSVDTKHPIDYRPEFNTSVTTGQTQTGAGAPTINGLQHIIRPRRVSEEVAALGHRSGPLATAVSKGARLADTLVLRGLQLAPCNPSFVDTRDSILLADREVTGGENQAIIWRAFASHGVGLTASSSGGFADDMGTQSAFVVKEDFSVPAGVIECEEVGPLGAPQFTVANSAPNQVTVTITPVAGATAYVISRGESADGRFTKVGETSQTTFVDNNEGEGLSAGGKVYYYQVRAARNPQCVSTAQTASVAVTQGSVVTPAPIFVGVSEVTDPAACDRLVVNWRAALSLNPNANIVYDIYRTDSVPAGDGTADPAFTPTAANRIASGVTGTSYVDRGLTLGRVYYYIVQARDLNNGKIDSFNAGNRAVAYNAPTAPASAGGPFAAENYESVSSSTRFTPPLVESGADPNEAVAAWQRVTAIDQGNGTTSSMMYAPDFSPAEGTPDPAGTHYGGPSDFSAVIGPLSISSTSMIEFDHFYRTEANFDGGVLELALGAPVFNSTPYPDNTTTFDLGNYIVQGRYNAKLDGTLEGVVPLSILQGRRAWTGTSELHHVRVSLNAFAPGSANNPAGLPVFIRFRMTSDAATSAGFGGGWYIDNLVVRNLSAASCPTVQIVCTTVDDSDARIEYFGGWDRVDDASATSGGLRRHVEPHRDDSGAFADLTFSGAREVTYQFVRGPRGGRARVTVTNDLTGVVKHDATIDYYAPAPAGSNGNSWKALTYGQSQKFGDLDETATYTLRIDPVPTGDSQRKDVYVDGFTLCGPADSGVVNNGAYSQGATTLTAGTSGLLGSESAHTFTVGSNAAMLSATLDFVPTANLDLYVYDSAGRLIGSSATDSGTEVVHAPTAAAGTYRVVIVNRGDLATAYVLTTTPTIRR